MSNTPTAGGHAGDVSPRQAWDTLQANEHAQLIDVRTRPEWSFVGLPDLSGTGREPILLEWQLYPSMGIDGTFAEKLEAELEKRGVPDDAPLLFLCRSGVRSANAAALMTSRGRAEAYNIEGGFEGPHDENRHRGTREGWKAQKLPWRQS